MPNFQFILQRGLSLGYLKFLHKKTHLKFRRVLKKNRTLTIFDTEEYIHHLFFQHNHLSQPYAIADVLSHQNA